MPNEIRDAIEIGKLLMDLIKIIMDAVQGGDVARVNEILASELRTPLERTKAELEALKKFGPRPE